MQPSAQSTDPPTADFSSFPFEVHLRQSWQTVTQSDGQEHQNSTLKCLSLFLQKLIQDERQAGGKEDVRSTEAKSSPVKHQPFSFSDTEKKTGRISPSPFFKNSWFQNNQWDLVSMWYGIQIPREWILPMVLRASIRSYKEFVEVASSHLPFPTASL